MAVYTLAEIETLRRAIAMGALRVVYDGPPKRDVTYRSLAEMRSILAEMEADQDDAPKKVRAIRFTTSKGLD